MATPRYNHTQQVGYLRGEIAWNSPGVATGVNIGAIPAGAQVVDCVVNVKTAFNAGTTNVLAVGTTGTGAQIATSAETASGSTGGKRCVTGLNVQPSTDTDIWASFTQTGTAASAGLATVVVTYVQNNDR